MDEKTSVRELEQRRREAMLSADVAVLDALLSPDLAWIHATARVDTKDTLLRSIGSGSTKYLEIAMNEDIYRDCGDAVLMGGTSEVKGEVDGAVRAVKSRYTIVWSSDADGRWRVLNWQSTRLPTD